MTSKYIGFRGNAEDQKQLAALKKVFAQKRMSTDTTDILRMALHCLWEREVVKGKGDKKT